VKSKTTQRFTIRRKARKGPRIQRIKTFPPFRTGAEHQLRWLLGFAQESSALRSPSDHRWVEAEVRAYLGDLHIRRTGKRNDGRSVGGTLTSTDFSVAGRKHQKSFEEQLECIRTDVRRIVTQFLAPTPSLRVTGKIAWQRILEKAPGRTPTFRVQRVVTDVRKGIIFRLLEDLEKVGTLLRQCPAPGCERVFVRRYRQEFCSTACRNRANFRIWYQRTRKARKGIVMSPHVKKRKRFTYLKRTCIMANSKRRTEFA
jgi:CGNR zinc finger